MLFASRCAEKASSQVQGLPFGLRCHLSGDLNSPGAAFFTVFEIPRPSSGGGFPN